VETSRRKHLSERTKKPEDSSPQFMGINVFLTEKSSLCQQKIISYMGKTILHRVPLELIWFLSSFIFKLKVKNIILFI